MSKTIYHSELVRLCDGNPITVKITSDVQKSQYKRNGKDSYYVSMQVDGSARTYTCENQACEDALDKLKGKTIELIATGRDEDAAIEVIGESESRREEPPSRGRAREREPQREERPGRREEPPPRQPAAGGHAAPDPALALKKFKVRLARGAKAYRLCFDAAASMVADGAWSHAEVKDAATTLFIYMDRSGMIESVPLSEPKTEQPPPPKKPEPEPEPADDAADDDIPF